MAKFRTDDLPDIKTNPGAYAQVLAQKLDHMFSHLSMENFAQNAWSETPLATSILIADENGLYDGKTVEQALQEAAESNAKKQAALTFDTTPTDGSLNPVTSGGLFTSFAKKQADLSPSFTSVTSISVANSSSIVLTSKSLSAGTYLIFGSAQFSNNSTGVRGVSISSSTSFDDANSSKSPACNGWETAITFWRYIGFSSTTTMRLVAYQNSGSTLTATIAYLLALKIG